MFSSNSLAQISSERNKSASYGIEMMLKLSTVFNQMSDLCKSAVVEFSKDIALNQEFQNFTKFRVSDEGQSKLTVVKKVNRKQRPSERSPFQKIRGRKNPEIKPQPSKSRTPAPKESDLKLSDPQPILEEKPKAEYQPRRSQRTERVNRRIVSIVEEKKQNLDKENGQKVQNLQKKQPSAQKAKDEKPATPQKQANKREIEFKQPYVRIPRQKTKDPILVQNSDLKPTEGKRANRSNKKPNIVLSLSESQISSQPSDYKARRASNQRRKASTSNSKRGESRRKPKKPQLQDGKKRPINGFMRFFQQVKDEIKKNNKINGLPGLSHLISVEWSKLTDEQQEKYNDAYYVDLEKMKEDGTEIKRTQRRKRPARKSKRNNPPREAEHEEEPESIKNEIASDKEAQNAEEEESGTSSEQEPEEEEESPKVSKDRKNPKVKISTAKKEQEQEPEEKEDDDEEEESGESSESSASEDSKENEESSSGQDNSESSSEDANNAKESKSNSKNHNSGRSDKKKKK